MLNVSTSYSCPLILLLNTFEKYIKNKIHQNDLSGGPGEKIIVSLDYRLSRIIVWMIFMRIRSVYVYLKFS